MFNGLDNIDWSTLGQIPHFKKPSPSTVHLTDQPLLTILNLDSFKGIIAGGAALTWYQGFPINNHDVDIFFPDHAHFKQMYENLLQTHPLSYSSKDADTFTVNIKDLSYKVQLIKQRFFSNPVDLIESFDINISRVATDGVHWYLGTGFAQDLKNRKLNFTYVGPLTLKRLIKYWTYGFEPDQETFDLIMQHPEVIWDFTGVQGEYSHEA